MTATATTVRERLAGIEDPALGESIVDLGVVNAVRVTPDRVEVSLALHAPYAPEERLLVDRVRAELADVDREVRLYADHAADGTGLPGVKNVLAVVADGRDAGRAAVTAGVAIDLAERGARVGLLGADVGGPDVSRLVGVDGAPTLDETGTLVPPERRGLKVMALADALGEPPAVTAGPLAGRVLEGLVHDVAWRPLDYLLVDLPPVTDDVAAEFLETGPVTGAVVVAPPGGRVRHLASAVEAHDVPVLGAVTAGTAVRARPRAGTHEPFHECSAPESAVPRLGSVAVDPEPCGAHGRDGDADGERSAAVTAIADAVLDAVGRYHRRRAGSAGDGETPPSSRPGASRSPATAGAGR